MNTGRLSRVSANADPAEAEIARLLSQRFGDGLVYIAEERDHKLLEQAVADGLVSSDGHLTVAGYRALKRSARD